MPKPNPEYERRLARWLRENGFEVIPVDGGLHKVEPHETGVCLHCGGTGLKMYGRDADPSAGSEVLCDVCGGTGRYIVARVLPYTPAPNKRARRASCINVRPTEPQDYNHLNLSVQDKKFLAACGIKA